MQKDDTSEGAAHEQADRYSLRINRVIDYIEENMQKDLSLRELAGVACFSPFHFHRIFSAIVGEPLNQFVQRLRLEKAATQLIMNPKKSVTEIALDCGFSSSATFARSFSACFGMSASAWRNGNRNCSKIRKTVSKECKESDLSDRYPLCEADEAIDGSPQLHHSRRNTMQMIKAQSVKVDEIPEFSVAYIRHIGPYKEDVALFEKLFGRLFGWAGPRGLLESPDSKTLVIYHDNPEITEDDKLRISACLIVPANTPVEGEVGKMTVQGGNYLSARYELAGNEFQAAWNYVYGVLLPESGFQPDDGPCFELYDKNSSCEAAGKFALDICVPVRPL